MANPKWNRLDPWFESNFNTTLSPVNEKKFLAWVALNPDIRGSHDYDARGYWLNGGWKDTGAGHMPDTYKKPNHSTFSAESIYHNTPAPDGGQWVGGRWNGNMYQPSQRMLDLTHDWGALKQYMADFEPGTSLIPPLMKSH